MDSLNSSIDFLFMFVFLMFVSAAVGSVVLLLLAVFDHYVWIPQHIRFLLRQIFGSKHKDDDFISIMCDGGNIRICSKTGNVKDHGGVEPYLWAFKFDLYEYRRQYPNNGNVLYIDILDIGYWYVDAKLNVQYEPADLIFRRELTEVNIMQKVISVA